MRELPWRRATNFSVFVELLENDRVSFREADMEEFAIFDAPLEDAVADPLPRPRPRPRSRGIVVWMGRTGKEMPRLKKGALPTQAEQSQKGVNWTSSIRS
jgi:hypothetical protein